MLTPVESNAVFLSATDDASFQSSLDFGFPIPIRYVSSFAPLGSGSASSDPRLNFAAGRRTVLASQGIDVNRAPVTEIEIEEDAAASSPNSTVSTESSGAKRRYDAGGGGDEMDGDRACSRAVSDEEDGDGSRKKLRLSKEQGAVLEESFKENHTLNPVSHSLDRFVILNSF